MKFKLLAINFVIVLLFSPLAFSESIDSKIKKMEKTLNMQFDSFMDTYEKMVHIRAKLFDIHKKQVKPWTVLHHKVMSKSKSHYLIFQEMWLQKLVSIANAKYGTKVKFDGGQFDSTIRELSGLVIKRKSDEDRCYGEPLELDHFYDTDIIFNFYDWHLGLLELMILGKKEFFKRIEKDYKELVLDKLTKDQKERLENHRRFLNKLEKIEKILSIKNTAGKSIQERQKAINKRLDEMYQNAKKVIKK